MAKQQCERKASAFREVTVRLHGWHGEVRMLSAVEPCWMVDLEFSQPGKGTMVHTVFESDDYDKALSKYETFRRIVQ